MWAETGRLYVSMRELEVLSFTVKDDVSCKLSRYELCKAMNKERE